MSAEINCPVVLLNGQKFTLLKVMLFDEDGVQEVAKLRAQAAKSLGGSGLGVGVFGSPSWTLLGEAAALSVIGGLLAGASQKQGIETLQTAQSRSEAVARRGVYVDFAQVTNNQSPHPGVWSVTVVSTDREIEIGKLSAIEQYRLYAEYGKTALDVVVRGQSRVLLIESRRRYIHNGDEFVNVETDLGGMSIRWGQVAAYFPPEQSPDVPIKSTETNFIQPKPVPWAKANPGE